MNEQEKIYTASFRAQLAIEAFQEKKRPEELAAKYGVPPQFVLEQKKRLEELGPTLFEDKRRRPRKDDREAKKRASLEKIRDRLQMEVNWLKRKHEEIFPGTSERMEKELGLSSDSDKE